MCLQCFTDAEIVIQDFMPGFALMVAKKDADIGPEEWPKGWYGLVECNGPTCILPPVPEPDTDEFDKAWYTVRDEFYFPPEVGFRIVSAAAKVGYIPGESGDVAAWLMERIYELTKDIVPHPSPAYTQPTE
jgi:hypothetical protein